MNMLSNIVMLLLAIVAFVNAESILMTEVFIIPIKPETFDWNDDGKEERYYLITNNDIEKDLHRRHHGNDIPLHAEVVKRTAIRK